MRVNRNPYLFGLFFLLLILSWAICECFEVISWGRGGANVGESFADDLTARRNEILCAHKGVNSFRIWNREVLLEGFHPHNRPDKPNVAVKPGDRNVHAYPAWHTAYFYFYGWLPERVFYSMLGCLFGLCLMCVVYELKDVFSKMVDCPWVLTMGAFALVAPFVFSCFIAQNYGMLILALIFLMARSLETNHQVMAGVFWAVAMVKPQMAALLVFPLFFQRRYLTIVTAGFVCIGATIVTAYCVDESALDLVLQVPQIGAPYTATHFFNRLIGPSFNWLQIALFGTLCAFLCYKMKDAERWYYRCAPVALCAPLWTYNQPYDNMIFVIWYCVVAHELLAQLDNQKGVWKSYIVCCFSLSLLLLLHDIVVIWSGRSVAVDWCGRLIRAGWYVSSFAMLFYVVKKHGNLNAK